MKLALNKKFIKAVSLQLVFLFLFHILTPTIVLGLTNGPNQMEFSGATVGSDNMVDAFSGDFSYSIPLITIPGFEQGIPLSLNYNAGVTMEQEASWVGLGWSLNTGAIHRNVRGLPDDYNGAVVIKEKNVKPDETYVVKTGVDAELGGAFSPNVTGGLTFRFNNYRGFGFGYNIDLGLSLIKSAGLRLSGSLKMDSQEGTGLGVALNKNGDYNGGVSSYISSRNGIESISFNTGYKGFGIGKTISSTGSFLPSIEFSRITKTKNFSGKFGTTLFFNTGDLKMDVTHIKSQIESNKLEIPAYGYLNLQNALGGEDLMDFNRENDALVTERSSVISNPVATYDILSVNAPGLMDQIRGYRSDYGIFTDPVSKSEIDNFGFGAEVEVMAGEVKAGVNIQNNVWGHGSSTPMYSNTLSGYNTLGFKGDNPTQSNGFYKPAELISLQEVTENSSENIGYEDIEGSSSLTASIKYDKPSKSFKLKSYLKSNPGGNQKLFTSYENKRSKRFVKQTTYQYLTYSDQGLVKDIFGKDVSGQIQKINAITPGGKLFEFGMPLYNTKRKEVVFSVNHNYGVDKNDYLGKYTTYTEGSDNKLSNSSGVDNFYSSTQLPAYAYTHLLTNIYSNDYVDVDNNGTNEIDFGEYVHYEYNITSLGGTLYKWRVPYGGTDPTSNYANFHIGSLSTNEDDKASYTYGEKQIAYVASIETKTHIAEFTTTSRQDGLPVGGEGGNIPTTSYTGQERLKKIELFVKGADYEINGTKEKIKTVWLEYNYSLCPGVPNSTAAETGKLTLEKVYFTYGKSDNSMGKMSPYVFGYLDEQGNGNPGWDENLINNWGSYQTIRFDQELDVGGGISTVPVSNQSDGVGAESARRLEAGSWNLKEITLPSGGKIKVEYEPDDYGYVQNYEAMMMVEIAGTNKYPTGLVANISNEITKENDYLILKVPRKLLTTLEAKKCVSNLLDNRIFFKAFVDLKSTNGSPRYTGSPGAIGGRIGDYVSGYADIVPGTGDIYASTSSHFTYISVQVKPVKLSYDKGGETHPIRKAALQYLRYSQPLLLGSYIDISNGSLKSIGTALIAPFKELKELFIGFYKGAAQRGYGKKLFSKTDTEDYEYYPSYAKINVPRLVKFGGGHRVAKITVSDQWENSTGIINSETNYVKEYIYKNSDGSSTGVASYEPMAFNEENPLKKALYYGEKKMFYRDDHMFIEEPIGNSFFPGASVGYSKVIIKNASIEDVTIGTSGILVKEFYTAKDFPVKTKRNTIVPAKYLPPEITIPFVGVKSQRHYGYSQGIMVETNDMHGKLKMEGIKQYLELSKDDEVDNPNTFYKQLLLLENSLFTSSITYNYFTNEDYNPESINELSSEVTVLEDGLEVTKELGKIVGFYSSSRKNKNEVQGRDILINATVKFPPPFVLPMGNVRIVNQQESYREFCTTKVISRKGILKSIDVFDGLSTVSTENLIFDPETGEAILTKVNNEYGDPVYSYSIKGPIHYPNMAGAYKNIDYEITGADFGTTPLDKMPFEVGDKVSVKTVTSTVPNVNFYKIAEVDISNNKIVVENGNGILINWVTTSNPFGSTDVIRIVGSGNRNWQNQDVATIVSLNNPITDAIFPVDLNATNVVGNVSINSPVEEYAFEALDITSCAGDTLTFGACKIYATEPDKLLYYFDQMYSGTLGSPILTIKFDKDIFGLGSPGNPSNYFLHQAFNTSINGRFVQITHNGIIYTGELVESESSIGYCLDGVLNASANSFTEDLGITNDIYSDVMSPFISNTTQLSAKVSKIISNPFYYANKGAYKGKSSYLYRIPRVQEENTLGVLNETNVREDGVYELFNYFSPLNNAINKNWQKKTLTERYSPYLGGIENSVNLSPDLTSSNKLYSTVIMGHRNKVPIMIAKNAKYFEIAFNSFEEEGSTVLSGTKLKGHLGGALTNITTVETTAHTGKKSVEISPNGNIEISYQDDLSDMVFGQKKYFVEMWVKKEIDLITESFVPQVQMISSSNSALGSDEYDVTKTNIDGWQRFVISYVPSSGDKLKIINNSTGKVYVDDIRISPSNSSVKSFVYDSKYLRRSAELDNRNYATFYNYSETGNVVQVKKESERGIHTVQMNQGSIHIQ